MGHGQEKGKGQNTPPSDCHARAVGLKAVADRVDYIADLMRDLQWRRGKTGKELAQVWGVSKAAVEKYAAEASRRVRAEVQDPDEVGRTVCSALSQVLQKTMAKGEYRTTVRAADTWAQIAGAKAAEKHEVSTTIEATPADASKVMKDLFGQVTPDKDEDAAEPEPGSNEDASGA